MPKAAANKKKLGHISVGSFSNGAVLCRGPSKGAYLENYPYHCKSN